jgi:hypothetical protein
MKRHHKPKWRDILQKTQPALLKPTRLCKNKENLRNHHRPENTNDFWLGFWIRKRTCMENPVIKICSLAVSNVAKLIS